MLLEGEKERRAVEQSSATTALFLGLCHVACRKAATYKPPMLVPRVRSPGGRMCLAAIRERVLLKKEFAPTWKHPALVGGKSGAKSRLEGGLRGFPSGNIR